MKRFLRIILLIGMSVVFSFAEETILINSGSYFQFLIKNKTLKYDSLALKIHTIDFGRLNKKSIKASFPDWGGLASLRSIVFQDIPSIPGDFLTWFLSVIPQEQITTLELINVKINGDLRITPHTRFSKLEKLSIINTDLDEEFFENFNTRTFPNLHHLELIKCDLDEDIIPLLRKTKIVEQLEDLDLSQNDLGNDVFLLFPFQHPGKLKRLKLNQCEIVLDKNKNYTREYLAVNANMTINKYAVDWNSPFFNKLEHLELQNTTENLDEIRKFLQYEKFQNLNVLLGFLPSFKKDGFLIDKKKTQKMKTEFIEIVSSFPMQSVRNNYIFESPKSLNIFLKSTQAKVSENIILTGDRWNYYVLDALLSSNQLPALKELIVINTPLTQCKLNKIINAYKKISVTAILRDSGEFWPGITKQSVQSVIKIF